LADLTETVVYRGGMRGYGLKYLVLEVENASVDDTVTVGELTTIKDTVAFELDDGAAVPCTETTNVITIDTGGTLANKPLAILVSGW